MVAGPKISTGKRFVLALTTALTVTSGAAAADADANSVAALSSMSIEELANIKIVSVSRKAEPLSGAPAAIYVITNEDIRRSGKTSIPEMLRLAPNLVVAGVDSSTFAISARGFNSTTANKLLVQIDGRSIYTPLYSGVFWDAQDVMPDDLDRIEVISGPAGTLWGGNAVNGVINILTRSSRDTQGLVANVGGGNFERSAGARYGGKINDDATYRVYAKGFDRLDTVKASGVSAKDAWENAQGGFRLDWNPNTDTVMITGDVYSGSIQQPVGADKTISGGNVLARWVHPLPDGSSIGARVYYDRVSRDYPGTFGEARNTYDAFLQYQFPLGTRQEIVAGAEYRTSADHITNSPTIMFLPADRTLDLGNAFVQDSITLTKRLKLTVGVRLEHNTYTGWENMPSARLGWKINDKTLLWSAISRAVRTPSRIDRDFYSPGVLAGGPDFQSEELTAYELGYRAQPTQRLSFSISAFYNVYNDLRSFEPATAGKPFPVVFVNNIEGHTYGGEMWGNYEVNDWWRLSAGFNMLQEELKFKPGTSQLGGIQTAGNDPSHKITVRSSMNLSHDVELDVGLRMMGALPNPRVPGYAAVDGRVGWNVSDHVTLALTADGLLNRRHPEFGAAGTRSDLGRTFYVSLKWKS